MSPLSALFGVMSTTVCFHYSAVLQAVCTHVTLVHVGRVTTSEVAGIVDCAFGTSETLRGAGRTYIVTRARQRVGVVPV